MAYGKTKATGTAAQRLRKRVGAWLQQSRKDAELTQRELANICGFAYYTFVSQIENGEARVPPESYETYARALGITPRAFAKQMLRYYDPYTYRALFASDSNKKDNTND